MNFDQTSNHLFKLYMSKLRQTVMLSGAPGIGKSECVKHAAQRIASALEMKFVDLGKVNRPQEEDEFGFLAVPMTVVDPLDFGGIPAVLNGVDGGAPYAARLRFTDLIPARLMGLIVFDDLPTAPPLTQASAFRTVWERDYIGDDWMIVATGNRAEDRAATNRMPTPIVSKMGWVDFEPDLLGWSRYMATVDGSHLVRAYLQHDPSLFVNFDPKHPGPFACPRTWSALSEMCKAYEPELPPFETVKGWVGEGPAMQFCQFAEMANELVNPDTILLTPDTADVPSNPGALYVVTTALASRATGANLDRILTYLYRLPEEFQIYCIRSALEVEKGREAKLTSAEAARVRKIGASPAFVDFATKNQDLLL